MYAGLTGKEIISVDCNSAFYIIQSTAHTVHIILYVYRRCTMENRYVWHLRKSIPTRKLAADNSDWMETVRNCGHEICISFITLARGLRESVKKTRREK